MLGERDPSFFTFTNKPVSESHGEEESLTCWQAPSIATVSWIPLRNAPKQLPAYFRSTWNERLALRALLESGNETPPAAFSSPAAYVQYLDAKDFRAALAIDEPKLYCEPDGTPRRFTCWRGHRIGFTPIPGRLFDPMPGAGDEYCTAHAIDRQVTFNYWLAFKLGKLADWAGAAMVGHRAPSAIIHVELVMRSNGSGHLTCHSSFVPSHSLYLDWKLTGEYNMLSCQEPQFRGFIEAGKCRNAPVEKRFGTPLLSKRIR